MSEATPVDGIQARVEELISRMTPAEKAGQLTQYFYFRLPAGAATEPALGMDPDAQPRMDPIQSDALPPRDPLGANSGGPPVNDNESSDSTAA